MIAKPLVLFVAIQTTMQGVVYFAAASAFYWVFWGRRWSRAWSILDRSLEPGTIRREVTYTLLSLAASVPATVAIYLTYPLGWTRLYLSIADRGWPYFFLSVVLMLLLQDAYFFWVHYLLHRPWWYARFHKIHHLSTNSDPWTTLSTHPVEAFLMSGMSFLMLGLIPLHPAAITTFGVLGGTVNVLGHCGYEFFPSWYARHWLLRWCGSSTYHNLHHRPDHRQCNLALTFTWWDRWLGTFCPEYEEEFESLAARAAARLTLPAAV